MAVPAVLVAAVFFPALLKTIPSHPPEGIFRMAQELPTNPPSFAASFLTAVSPVVLMASATLALLLLPEGHGLRRWLAFWGDSGIAVMLAFSTSALILVLLRRQSSGAALEKATDALGAIAGLMLIIAAGGAYKQVLIDSGICQHMADQVIRLPFSPLILGWLIATALRLTVGSATVAGITAAGIVLPLIRATGTTPELMALAIGAGSVMCSHVNDTGFWMFREWFGVSLADTFKAWTVMETLVGLTGLLMVLVLSRWF